MAASIFLHPDALAVPHSPEPTHSDGHARLVRLFAADAPALLARIELAHERRDLAQVQQAAYQLRAHALALHANELADAAFRLEHLEGSQCGCGAAELKLAQLRVTLRDALLMLLEPSVYEQQD